MAKPSRPLSAHSCAFLVWRALGTEQPASRLVLAVLLARLQERPLPLGTRDGSPPPKDKACLRSLAVSLCHHPSLAAPELKGLHMAIPPRPARWRWPPRPPRGA